MCMSFAAKSRTDLREAPMERSRVAKRLPASRQSSWLALSLFIVCFGSSPRPCHTGMGCSLVCDQTRSLGHFSRNSQDCAPDLVGVIRLFQGSNPRSLYHEISRGSTRLAISPGLTAYFPDQRANIPHGKRRPLSDSSSVSSPISMSPPNFSWSGKRLLR